MRPCKEACLGGLGWVVSCEGTEGNAFGRVGLDNVVSYPRVCFSWGYPWLLHRIYIGSSSFLDGDLDALGYFSLLELALVQGCGLANGEFLVHKCVISNLSSMHRPVKLRYGKHFVLWIE